MKIKNLLCITAKDDNDSEYVPYDNIRNIVDIIKKKKVTLENLKDLQKLKNDSKEKFLKYLKEEVSNDELHELNEKVMENAKELVASNDPAFLLRRSEDAIFCDLLYLEVQNDNFKVKIGKEKNVKFNLPQNILKIFQVLTINFYKKNFENFEFQKALYKRFYSEAELPFEQLDDHFKLSLEREYIKESLAKSIMWLFVTRFIKDNYKIDDIEWLQFLNSLNDTRDSHYINHLKNKNIIYLIGYPAYDEVVVGDEIKILGNNISEE